MRKRSKSTLHKIEVDSKTAEPVIVEVAEEDFLAPYKEKREARKKEKKERLDNIKLSSSKMKEPNMINDRQLVMKQVFIPQDNTIDKKQRLFKNIFSITFIILMLVIIGYTAYKDFFASDQPSLSWAEVVDIFASSGYYLLLALLALFGCFFFKGLKLSVLCKSLTGKWHFKTCFETGIIGHYYNNVTPLGAGGQPFEIYYLSKHGVHGGVAASLPIATFFMYQVSFTTLSVFCLISLSPDVDLFNFGKVANEVFSSSVMLAVRPMAIVGLALCLLMPTMVVVFCIMPRTCSKIVHWVMHVGGKLKLVKKPKVTTYKTMKNVLHNSKCLKAIIHNPLILFFSLMIGFCEQLSCCSIAFFTLKFFGFNLVNATTGLEWLLVVQICLLLYSAVSFIPTPGNSGAADLSFFWLFSTGLNAGFAFPAMMTWRVLSFYSFIIIGFAFAKAKKRSDQRKEARLGK